MYCRFCFFANALNSASMSCRGSASCKASPLSVKSVQSMPGLEKVLSVNSDGPGTKDSYLMMYLKRGDRAFHGHVQSGMFVVLCAIAVLLQLL